MANSRFRLVVRAEPETEDETAHPTCFALGESASGGGTVSASAEASLLTLARVEGGSPDAFRRCYQKSCSK